MLLMEVRGKNCSDYSENLLEFATKRRPVSRLTMSATGVTKTVLIADDTAFVRDRFRTAIEAAGHRAITVNTEAGVLDALRNPESKPDLLVVDLKVPPAVGTTLVRKIRAIDADVPVLVLSGTVTSIEEVRELAGLSVAGYLNEYSAVQHILPSLAPQLFPDEHNRRSSPRVVLGIPVNYRVANKIAAALTLNLSHGGLAIRTTHPLAAGTTARLRLKLPGAAREIDVAARVQWSRPSVGMGLQFDSMAPDDQAAVAEFVDAHFFRSRKV
jgi:uncharacterized protein (TIGR02266 family)